MTIVVWYVLEHTPTGRHMFATGGNTEAARLSGVSTDRLTWGALVASGGVSGFAGLVFSWKFATYTTSVGPPLLFPAVAAVFFGASQLRGPRNIARFCENLERAQKGEPLVGLVDKKLGY